MGVSKVVINNADGTKNVLVDLTGDTVTADRLIEGLTAHGANGNLITGNMPSANKKLGGWMESLGESDTTYEFSGTCLSITHLYEYITGAPEVSIMADRSSFGTATSRDVAMGVTFTSENGVNIVGTNPAGKWATAYNMSAAYNMTASAGKITLSQMTGSEDHGFKLVSGGLQCPYAGTLVVTGAIMLGSGYTANDQIHIRAYRNSSATGPDIVHRKVSTSNGTVQITTVVSVAAGDMIYLYAYNQTAARGTVQAVATTRITAAYIG